MTMDPEPCPCGRSLVRAAAVDGRHDELLSLPARGGGTVTVLPAQFSAITRDRAVREFQVRQEPGGVRVLVVPCDDGDPELEAGCAPPSRGRSARSAPTRAWRSSAAPRWPAGEASCRSCRPCRAKLSCVNVAAAAGEAELDEVELAAWQGLLRVHAALVKELDAELEARHGLPLTSYEVLRSSSATRPTASCGWPSSPSTRCSAAPA